MGGKYGVKATEDVLAVVKVALVAVLKEVKKDGFQLSDLGAFLKSPDFEAALAPALAEVSQVPSEMTELDLMDDFDLGRWMYKAVLEVSDALKTPAA